ncbi:F420-non-reducing hydrogenase iron-sulfur subunit D [Geobacter sp. OR-1]|uniref:hydrogenase iron-sulfur subunit n=1 Tax=Geobacter sp. OR-1 TaxID=1266765 RepID=UPI0005422B41|nr:hydrogenase iron-sulfur subunit [Geobacter sp. OR-1]GAM09905.1 F420-non-reducing hydrogenase iron-sulfur subunit D [Geobacter sp. OR-1]
MTGLSRIRIIACSFGWGYSGNLEQLTLDLPDLQCVVCCGSVGAEEILGPLHSGYDGVLLLACPMGECHFQDGEWQCLKRVGLLKALLSGYGLDPERLAVRFGNDPEGESIAAIAGEFAEKLAEL